MSGEAIVCACKDHARELSKLTDELSHSTSLGSGERTDVLARSYVTECLIKEKISLLGASGIQKKYGPCTRDWFLFADEYYTFASDAVVYTGLDIRRTPKNESFTRPVCIVEESTKKAGEIPIGIYVRTGSFANANHRRPPERSIERFTDVFSRIDHGLVFFLPKDYLDSRVAEKLREKRIGVGSLGFSSLEFRDVLEASVVRSV